MSTQPSVARITEADIRGAIRRNELFVQYQPIVSAQTGRPVCVEALVRWRQASGEIVMPNDFIDIAEQSDVILELGAWVLRRACTDGLRWPGIRIAVNMSPVQLQNADFVQSVRTILRETGLPAEQLELELTERSALKDVAMAETGMAALRACGVRIALDDFGTGYSGLIYLRRLPLDKIKIDREFLASLGETGDASVLVRSMVRLGRDLGMTVTAEGVEEIEHQAILAEAGCDELQGYLFSRPVSADDIDAMFGMGCKKRQRLQGAA